MRHLLVWLIVFGVIAGLSTRFAAGAGHHLVLTHSHEHDGDHHHHQHEVPAHDHGGEECPDSSHEHHHLIFCSPLVWVADRMDDPFHLASAGVHLGRQSSDEAAPEGPFLELDTPPLI